MRPSFDIILAEIKASRMVPAKGLPIIMEYVSKYRRIVVLNDGSGFTIKVSYKGICSEIKPWEKAYGNMDCARPWALAFVENRSIRMGILTITEARGKWIKGQ